MVTPESMAALYASVRTSEEDEVGFISYPEWKGVEEYHDPIDPSSLSANFADIFPDVSKLLNMRTERAILFNDITQDNNKVLEDENTEMVQFHALEERMRETLEVFQSVAKAEEREGGTQEKRACPVEGAEMEGGPRPAKQRKGCQGQAIPAEGDKCSEQEMTLEKGVIRTGRKIYRPSLLSTYREPELSEDLNDRMEWVFRDYGRSLKRTKEPLPPREDIVEFEVGTDSKELEKNLKLQGCPKELQGKVKEVVADYWDVFCEEGFRRPMRGFSFQIDTGDHPPICCKQPRYGPHESEIMRKLVAKLDENGVVEDDEGPLGALVVLAAKPHQENVPWHEYQWRLCVSYRRLNQVTKPFVFPIPRCDDAVEDIDTEARYFIAVDMDSGYWQVVAEKEARERLTFFTQDEKNRWKVMPMGALNSAPTFVAMMMKLQEEWDALARSRGLTNVASKVIIDDVLLYGRKADQLLQYFRTVLDVLQHHRDTLKLKKCKWFQDRCEFVGMDVAAGGTKPAQSKSDTFAKLGKPHTWGDLRMIIGMFGFYSKFLPLYELDIKPWRHILSRQPPPGELSAQEENKLMDKLWGKEEDELLQKLKDDIISGPMLARPDPARRFYIKTDWSKDGMGAVLLQAENSEEARDAEDRERAGGKCEFDKSIDGLRLRPICFVSRATASPLEKSRHSFVGEAATVRWAIGKFRKYLWGSEFTVLTDCSGLQKFFESEANVPHVIHRWRAELLQYQFVIEHRPARMMWECDMLSRYNRVTEAWRQEKEKNEPTQESAGVQTVLVGSENEDKVVLFSEREMSGSTLTALHTLPPLQFVR